MFRSRAPLTIAPASGCSLTLSRLAARRSRSSAAESRRRFYRHEARSAFRERSCFVHDESRHAFEDLQRLSVAHQDAELGAASRPDHDGHRRRESERARAGDDQHRDGVDQRVREAWFGTEEAPDDEGGCRHEDHGRDEPARDHVCEPLNRGARPLGLADEPDDARQQRVAADPVGAHHERAGPIQRAAGDSRARSFLDRNRLARDHRLIDSGRTFDDDTVDRRVFAWPHPQEIADADLLEADVAFRAVGDSMRNLRRKLQERPDRRARLAARAQLQHLAEEDQHDDDRRSLEVDGDLAVIAKRGREDSRGDRRNDAVAVCRADAQGNQREHVGVAVHDRRPAPLEERRSTPEDNRRGEDHLAPRNGSMPERAHQGLTRQEVPDHHRQDGCDQRERDPEPARHVLQFRVLLFGARIHGRLERHAALRARAGADLAHLGVHRARVLDALWQGGGSSFAPRRIEEGFGVVPELLDTGLGAEVVGPSLVVDGTDRIRRRDRHPAHRVDHLQRLRVGLRLRLGLHGSSPTIRPHALMNGFVDTCARCA